MGNRRHERIPAMDYRQYRRARRLVRECCNYDNGQCIMLDEGDGCVCVQSISHSLLCRWFRVAVLPLDHQLETALYTGWKAGGAASAALFSFPAPTGRNTVRSVPPGCAGGRRQNAKGKDTMILRI